MHFDRISDNKPYRHQHRQNDHSHRKYRPHLGHQKKSNVAKLVNRSRYRQNLLIESRLTYLSSEVTVTDKIIPSASRDQTTPTLSGNTVAMTTLFVVSQR